MASDTAVLWQNRIVGYGLEAPDQLLANPWNWRIHSQFQQDALAGILNTVGIVQNVIVNRTSGHIVDGHLRVTLALRTGQPLIPVTYVELSEAEERLILSTLDPLGALAATDSALLADLLADVSTGDAAVQRLLDGLAATIPPVVPLPGGGGDEFDGAPHAGPTQVQPGDLWQIGPHRLLCGDSTHADAVARLMDGARAALLLIDPPYNLGALGEMPITDYVAWLGGAFTIYLGVANAEAPALVFGYPEIIAHALPLLTEQLPLQRWLSWFYHNGRLMPDGFKRGTEALLWLSRTTQLVDPDVFRVEISEGRRDNPIYRRNGRVTFRHTDDAAPSDWFHLPSLSGFAAIAQDRDHPSQKPLELPTALIAGFCAEGAIVLSPFLGSGVDIVAAHRTGRVCYGLELEPRYCDVILRRAAAEGIGPIARVRDG